MSCKHLKKYFQKYHIFISFATIAFLFYACNATKKVPEGEYLLTKNNFIYEDGKVHEDELPNHVSQKPNKKTLLVLPIPLTFYNLANPKYDTILNEYLSYPSEMRDQSLRDSLFIKNDKPEYVGKSLFVDRILRNFGQAPVILDQNKSKTSTENIRKRLIYRGYWDAEVKFTQKLDSANKKAQVNYLITHKDPTIISQLYYDIPDPNIKGFYERNLEKSVLRSKKVLDQTKLEDEVKRITKLMRDNGYYQFNSSNQEIYFTADTLDSRKLVPVTMDIHKDSIDSPYKIATIGNIDVAVVENSNDFKKNTYKDSLRGITFHKIDDQYKTQALWRGVTIKTGEKYDQKNLDLTKRNLLAMNNFSIIKSRDSLRRGGTGTPNDSIVDVLYILKPLPKYDLQLATDINYSQLLNFGISPSVDLTTRNVFGGAENLSTSISGLLGRVTDPQNIDKRIWASEVSAQATLNFPRLLLPFKYYKLLPKRYSPTSSINLGISKQTNIGLGRLTFNTGLNYFANVNDIVSHRLTIFNTQLSLTSNKDRYYEFFTSERKSRDEIFQLYSPNLYQDFLDGNISGDDLSTIIFTDDAFVNQLSGENLETYNTFLQSLINKDRQTQDVFISSFIYNFIYNEIGKKDYHNPFYFNGKVELAGNILNAINPKGFTQGLTTGDQSTVFNVPFSQFIKFDVEARKYFQFGTNTLALRQFIGVGIPYGNSTSMPFIRSYFNGGSNDIRAWTAFGGLGPADSQLDETVRTYIMDNVKLTTNIEYRIPLNTMYEAAIFTDIGNIWSLKDDGLGDQFKFNKFLNQVGVGSGFGLRINVAYITLRLDLAYKIHDPNQPLGERWRFNKIQPLKPTLNFAFGYPF